MFEDDLPGDVIEPDADPEPCLDDKTNIEKLLDICPGHPSDGEARNT